MTSYFGPLAIGEGFYYFFKTKKNENAQFTNDTFHPKKFRKNQTETLIHWKQIVNRHMRSIEGSSPLKRKFQGRDDRHPFH